MSQAQRELTAKNLKLAYKLAGPYTERAPHEREDLESAALLGLCEAAAAWDRSKGVPFSAFARRRILGALNGALRGAIRRGVSGPGEAPRVVPLDQAGEPTAARGPAAGGKAEEDKPGRDVERFEERIKPLARLQRDVCRKIFHDGLSYRETGAAIGFSYGFVARTRRQAIEALRDLETSTN